MRNVYFRYLLLLESRRLFWFNFPEASFKQKAYFESTESSRKWNQIDSFDTDYSELGSPLNKYFMSRRWMIGVAYHRNDDEHETN